MNKRGNFHVHFLGIGGISMSALAKYLKGLGFFVSGSDGREGDSTNTLRKLGIPVNVSGVAERCDLVVCSSAIASDDAQLTRLKELKKPVIGRARLLGEIASTFSLSVGVAGTHGKTTVTAMLAHIFKSAGVKFTAHIGGEDNELGNLYTGGDGCFLSEVCEYKRNLRFFNPTVGLLLSVDADHLESFGSLDSLKADFNDFCSRSQIAVAEHGHCFLRGENVRTFSEKNDDAHYFLKAKNANENIIESTVYEYGEPLFDLKIKNIAPNVLHNTAAAVATALVMGISAEDVKKGVSSFSGVKRRSEILGRVSGAEVYADYAHHPTQLASVIKWLEKRGGKTAILFQPHTYSRTKMLSEQFVSVLKGVSDLYIFDVYPAREQYDYLGSSSRLSSLIKGATYAGPITNVNGVIGALKGFDRIAVLGAGDLYDEVSRIIKK